LLLLASGLNCSCHRSPEATFQNAQQALRRGNLIRCLSEADHGYREFGSSSPEWSWKFKILKAEVLTLSGKSEDAVALFASANGSPSDPDSKVEMLATVGVALAHLHSFPDAERDLAQADGLCVSSFLPHCGDVLRARGVLAIERGQLSESREFFQRTLAFGRSHGDQFLEATALLNLAAVALKEEHFDEAVDWLEPAEMISTALGAGGIEVKVLGNLGWAYYNLGDSARALDLSLEAEKRAIQSGEIIDQLSAHTNTGYVYAEQGDSAAAELAYLEALDLARRIKNTQHIYNAYRALALVAANAGRNEDARHYSQEAITIARADNNRLNELFPLLAEGLVAAKTQEIADAERIFREVEQDKNGNASLKWRAQHGLARLYQKENRLALADTEYRAALSTFETARSSLKRDESKLPFSTNAASIYDDYVDFLVAHGKSSDALRWAEYSRARSLAEGLGLLAKDALNGDRAEPPTPNGQEIARRARGTLLFYWLGEKQSYLWAITPRKTNLYPLPPGAEIEGAVQRYRKALAGTQDVLEAADRDGQSLYRTLVSPAQALLRKDARVFIIPDGNLNSLNFETLIVSDPKLHYWIDDATISYASSLRILASPHSSRNEPTRRLLLVGDSVSPSKEYPELPKAAAQMEGVAQHFPGQRRVYAREQATPSAYLNSNPEQFSHIHFVAHGTASRLSPLDSAIVLSRSSASTDSFKLYARDIIQHRLDAELVTVSACYGAGERSYSGEGLVGLSWAFIRAGAHNVIAALWEATDTPTQQLMDRFYDELDHGAKPDAALRASKLTLLHGSSFHNPFYWAPFQLYTGS